MLRVLTAVFALLLAAGSITPISRFEARCGDASVIVWNSKKTVEQSHVEETRAASPPSILSRGDYQSRVVAWSSRFTLFQRPPPQNS